MLAGILAVATLMGGANAAEAPDRNPQRFRVEFAVSNTVDLTAAGQGVMTSDINGTAVVTLTMSDTTGGRIAHLVVDSLTVSADGQAAMMFNQAAADALIGEWVHGYVVDGKIEGAPSQSQEGNQILGLVGATLSGLFPGVGAKTATAPSWSDTTSVQSESDGTSRNVQTVVDWSVTGRDGDAYVLSGAANGTVTMDSPEQQISGTVISNFSLTSTIGGPASVSTTTSMQDLSLLVSALPDPLPVQVQQKFTVTEIK